MFALPGERLTELASLVRRRFFGIVPILPRGTEILHFIRSGLGPRYVVWRTHTGAYFWYCGPDQGAQRLGQATPRPHGRGAAGDQSSMSTTILPLPLQIVHSRGRGGYGADRPSVRPMYSAACSAVVPTRAPWSGSPYQ